MTEDLKLGLTFLVITLIVIWAFCAALNLFEKSAQNLNYEPPELVTIQGNSLMSISPPNTIISTTLSSLMERIIWCESTNNPKAINKKSGAYGLCQILPSTEKYLEKKWDMELNLEYSDVQLYACQRLYEEEGLSHWKASKNCWEN